MVTEACSSTYGVCRCSSILLFRNCCAGYFSSLEHLTPMSCFQVTHHADSLFVLKSQHTKNQAVSNTEKPSLLQPKQTLWIIHLDANQVLLNANMPMDFNPLPPLPHPRGQKALRARNQKRRKGIKSNNSLIIFKT